MCMASPVFCSSSSAAHPFSTSLSQNFHLQSELLAGSSSLDIHRGRSGILNTICKCRWNSYNHIATNLLRTELGQGKYHPNNNASGTYIGQGLQDVSKCSHTFLVGGGCRNENGAFGVKP